MKSPASIHNYLKQKPPPQPSFSWNLGTLQLWWRRDPIHGKFHLSPVSVFFPWIFKTCPQKRPNCPVSLKCRTKAALHVLAPPGGPRTLWTSWSAKCDSSSRVWKLCIYIFLPFIWQLVFFFITPGAGILSPSQKAPLQNKRTMN